MCTCRLTGTILLRSYCQDRYAAARGDSALSLQAVAGVIFCITIVFKILFYVLHFQYADSRSKIDKWLLKPLQLSNSACLARNGMNIFKIKTILTSPLRLTRAPGHQRTTNRLTTTTPNTLIFGFSLHTCQSLQGFCRIAEF